MNLKERSRYRLISVFDEQRSLMKSNKLEEVESYTDGFYSSAEISEEMEDSDRDPFKIERRQSLALN